MRQSDVPSEGAIAIVIEGFDRVYALIEHTTAGAFPDEFLVPDGGDPQSHISNLVAARRADGSSEYKALSMRSTGKMEDVEDTELRAEIQTEFRRHGQAALSVGMALANASSIPMVYLFRGGEGWQFGSLVDLQERGSKGLRPLVTPEYAKKMTLLEEKQPVLSRKQRLSIVVSVETADQLAAMARKTGSTKAGVLREAISRHLERNKKLLRQ